LSVNIQSWIADFYFLGAVVGCNNALKCLGNCGNGGIGKSGAVTGVQDDIARSIT
jgi:hypothetical protein